MKKIMVQYAQYNVWANQRIMDAILKLPEELTNQPVVSSFPTIRATMLHMWYAEKLWWHRMKMSEITPSLFAEFKGTVQELCVKWKDQSVQWQQWMETATEAAINHEFIYHDSKKNRYKQPVSEVALHLFNHQTYHRGQLVTMIRELGVTEIPATDVIAFFRKK